MTTEKGCTCTDWAENIDQLLMAGYLHAHGIEYDGKVMRYCPWCGAILTHSMLRDWLNTEYKKAG